MADEYQGDEPRPRGRGRVAWVLIFAFLLLLGGALVWSGTKKSAIATPELRKPEIKSYTYVGYPFHRPNPFPGGQLWIYATSNAQSAPAFYLFDLDTNRLVGQADITPLAYNEKDLTFLFETRDGSEPSETARNIAAFLGQRKKLYEDPVDYWIMKRGGQPALVAHTSEQHGGGGAEQLSPSGDYARIRTTTGDHFVIDIKNARKIDLPRLPMTSWMGGWWSNDEVFFTDSGKNIVLLNVKTLKTKRCCRATGLARS